ncbi:hypothetical protein M408DRAFT_124201 [Serendipita vermifera MAFF 305830]|uniref:Uncharacterized protein n=1 Tax=Serendipita vermifera MAFF 305830 TaxID=933852 RepID=A0A0C2WT73_SERVB|nr:hypothetical protein M408DRAFT_124201 [Serendipita vermifera MAFF 305830]
MAKGPKTEKKATKSSGSTAAPVVKAAAQKPSTASLSKTIPKSSKDILAGATNGKKEKKVPVVTKATGTDKKKTNGKAPVAAKDSSSSDSSESSSDEEDENTKAPAKKTNGAVAASKAKESSESDPSDSDSESDADTEVEKPKKAVKASAAPAAPAATKAKGKKANGVAVCISRFYLLHAIDTCHLGCGRTCP